MRALWFKQMYVEPILAGEKRDTIRAQRPAYQGGDVVPLSVGPRTPFARVSIESIERVEPSELAPPRRAEVERLYGVEAMELWRIRFVLVEECGMSNSE